MLKLNNKGWGMSTMIICTSLILIALLVSTFFAIRLYSQMQKSFTNNESSTETQKVIPLSVYHDMEDDLGASALEYMQDLNINLSDLSYKISYETLKTHGYVSKFLDTETKDECVGYVIIDSNYNYDAFLKCDSYMTKGYSD